MKTKLMLAAAVLATLAAPARAEMSGVPPEMQLWLLQIAMPTDAAGSALYWSGQWRRMVVQRVPYAMTSAEISGIPTEVQLWLLPPAVPAAEASVRQPRTTTGQGW